MFEALNSAPVNGSSAPLPAPEPVPFDVLGKLGISLGATPGYGVELSENRYGIELTAAPGYGVIVQQPAYGVILNDN